MPQEGVIGIFGTLTMNGLTEVPMQATVIVDLAGKQMRLRFLAEEGEAIVELGGVDALLMQSRQAFVSAEIANGGPIETP
jgi:hypothetical protein